MDEKHSQLWQKLSAALKPQVSPDTFKRWFSAVKLVQATDEALTFRVPNNIYQFWIESNHMAALQAAIVTAFGSPRHVKFVTASDGSTKKEEEVARLVLKGLTSAEIGAMMGNSEKTIKQHLTQVYAKLGVAGRAEFFHLVFPS